MDSKMDSRQDPNLFDDQIDKQESNRHTPRDRKSIPDNESKQSNLSKIGPEH